MKTVNEKVLKLQNISEESTNVWKDLRWTEEEGKKGREREKKNDFLFVKGKGGGGEGSIQKECKLREQNTVVVC